MNRIANRPSDKLIATSAGLENSTLQDFWKWAYSDVCDDDIKGVFAEWLVGKLLGIESARRVSWANSDLITPDGIRIEVKSTSYWQSWKYVDEFGNLREDPICPLQIDSRIGFAGLRASDATIAHTASSAQALKSHLYVFAFQNQKDFARWNALDLSQWEFYTLPVEIVEALGSRSISLRKLRSLHEPWDAATFAVGCLALIEECRAASRKLANT